MDIRSTQSSPRNRYFKLSLKKSKHKTDDLSAKSNRSSNIVILDESDDGLRLQFPKHIQSKPKEHSPIVIQDSDDDLPNILLNGDKPSNYGNVSFNCSNEERSPLSNLRPSIGGWSPAQNFLIATPKNIPIPSTPKDEMNESYEHCSLKKIHQSQKKILNDLYGDTWKSIPTLFKTISHKYDNFEGVSKKLFNNDDDSDTENIKHDLEKNKKLYLTGSDIKINGPNYGNTEKKSKKKLFTDNTQTPCVIKPKFQTRNVNSTTKKVRIKKGMTVTELVEVMKNDIEGLDDRTDENKEVKKNVDNTDLVNNIDKSGVTNNMQDKSYIARKLDIEELTKKIDRVDVSEKKLKNVKVTHKDNGIKRLTFIGSLADNVPSWRCHPEAIQYRDNYKNLREKLTRRLYEEFNKGLFNEQLDNDMSLVWDSKLRSTAGTTTNRLIKNAKGDRTRTSSIKLSTKVVDTPERLRDTLVHEMCHAATWLIDAELKAGHGPLWKKWATQALRVYPELGEISRCHNMEILFKYSYKCTTCGYSIHRHSKSIDITKKCCGYCRGTFEVVLNKKNKDGVIVSTPGRKGQTNGFAQYVKENYKLVKTDLRSHADTMKLLGEQFARDKNKST